MTIRTSLGVAVIATALILTGCAPAAVEPTPTASENPYGGFPVDPPAADDVVLTVVGATTIDYTMAELEALATETIQIEEPFVNEMQEFTGVPLATLFNAAGIVDADQVGSIALNDYEYADAAKAFTDSDGMLAVFRDGEPIPMDAGGPIRIVFPEGSEYFSFLDAWNWSLRSLEIAKE